MKLVHAGDTTVVDLSIVIKVPPLAVMHINTHFTLPPSLLFAICHSGSNPAHIEARRPIRGLRVLHTPRPLMPNQLGRRNWAESQRVHAHSHTNKPELYSTERRQTGKLRPLLPLDPKVMEEAIVDSIHLLCPQRCSDSTNTSLKAAPF